MKRMLVKILMLSLLILACGALTGCAKKVECDLCHGEKTIVCQECGGKGRGTFSCSECGGDGYSGTEQTTCSACGGLGKVYSPQQRALLYVQADVGEPKDLCMDCFGSGKVTKEARCSSCSGSGKVTGDCRECNGKGKVVCTKCEGKGFVTVQDDTEKVSAESAPATKPIVAFNFMAFPFGASDENIKYIMEGSQIPIADFKELDYTSYEPALLVLDYDFSLDEKQVSVQMNDVELDVEFLDNVGVAFTFNGAKERELHAISVSGKIEPLRNDEDIRALYSRIFAQLGAGEPEVQYREEAKAGGSNRYWAKGTYNGVNFTVDVNGGDSTDCFDWLIISYG